MGNSASFTIHCKIVHNFASVYTSLKHLLILFMSILVVPWVSQAHCYWLCPFWVHLAWCDLPHKDAPDLVCIDVASALHAHADLMLFMKKLVFFCWPDAHLLDLCFNLYLQSPVGRDHLLCVYILILNRSQIQFSLLGLIQVILIQWFFLLLSASRSLTYKTSKSMTAW